MTNERFCCYALASAALALALPAASARFGAGGDTCARTGEAARRAAEHEAQADYWIALALCQNESGGSVGACADEAAAALEEALEEIEDQHEARLELCTELGGGPYEPELDPDAFSADVTNPWLPLVPGRTLHYAKIGDEGLERVSVETLHETVEIDGIECRSVRDVEWIDGELVEETIDWFAQHASGDLWYLGEIAKNYEDGFLDDIDGSWRAGVDGAEAGIVMLRDPQPGDLYRQEYLIGEAEDIGRVIAIGVTVTVAYGTFHGCVQTEDTTPLEPDDLEHKFYAPGVGLVLELDVRSGERLELVDVR